MRAIDGTGEIVPEPKWDSLLTDAAEIATAREYWRLVTSELKERGLLSPANRHAVQRLVLAYLTYDRASLEVASKGAVAEANPANDKSIARLSPHFSAMRESGTDAANLEAELGISPRRRSSVTKVALRRSHQIAAAVEQQFEAARAQAGLSFDQTILVPGDAQIVNGVTPLPHRYSPGSIEKDVTSGPTIREVYDAYMSDPTRDWSSGAFSYRLTCDIDPLLRRTHAALRLVPPISRPMSFSLDPPEIR